MRFVSNLLGSSVFELSNVEVVLIFPTYILHVHIDDAEIYIRLVHIYNNVHTQFPHAVGMWIC